MTYEEYRRQSAALRAAYETALAEWCADSDLKNKQGHQTRVQEEFERYNVAQAKLFEKFVASQQ